MHVMGMVSLCVYMGLGREPSWAASTSGGRSGVVTMRASLPSARRTRAFTFYAAMGLMYMCCLHGVRP